jgi:VWFA-related protein
MQIRAAVVIVALALETALADQTQPRAPQRQTESFSAGTTAVLVDVVVRDRRGRPVLDLTADDFEIFEDTVRQALGSFSVVERSGGIGVKVGRRVSAPAPPAGTSKEPPAPPPATDAPTIAIVFDALRAEPLALAQKAALSYLPMTDGSEARVGVFSSDPALRVLQTYTDDLALARRAVYGVTATGDTKQETEAARRQVLNERLASFDALGVGRDSTAFAPGSGNPTAAQAIVELQMTELEMRMLRTFESLDRDQRGFGTADALFSVIRSLAVSPGRKTLVYLSEGLPASPAMQARLDTLVSAANQANVSVYTIDAAGLRAESALTETRREVVAAGEERLRQTAASRDPTNGPLTRVVERTEDLIRLDPHGGLARLAEDTGGFLIRDTNDLSSGFRRIEEDNRFHYLLTYSPSNVAFDGKFRRIQVRTKREGLQVFARKGYQAVRRPSLTGLSYEAAALAALDRGTPPNAFPINASGFVFPDPKGRAAVPIVVQVKTRDLHFQIDQEKGTYAAQAAIVANVKNAAGQTVHTLSQQYVLTGAAKDVDVAREGEILFYRQPDLAAGVYSLAAVVHDGLAERASARLSTLTVPAGSGARTPASTLVLVRQIEKVASTDQTSGLPFFYGDLLLYPNAGEPLRRGRDAELTFYFAFHDPPSGNPAAVLEILHSGRSLASVPIDVPRPGPDGRVQHVGKLPIDKFPPGIYELRLKLRTGGEEQLRTAFFTIVEK